MSRQDTVGNPEGGALRRVAVIMGSDSDYPTMRGAVEALRELGLSYEARVISAHRTPREMADFAEGARAAGFGVIIAGAGGAAHLPGMVAAHTSLPVIGVPVAHGPLQGKDALLSIVQMPKGVPVATVAIDNAYNAGILAAEMLAIGPGPAAEDLATRLAFYKESMRRSSMAKALDDAKDR